MCTDFRNNGSMPRGLRNNNPGNLRDTANWQGLAGHDSGGFNIYQNICWGVRALATDLTNKINRGLDTIAKIFPVYAPASDNNNVAAYINAVSSSSGIDPNEQLGTDPETLGSLIRAIADHENGGSAALTDADINQGISMMGLQVSQLPADVAQAVQDNPGQSAAIAVAIFFFLYLVSRNKG